MAHVPRHKHTGNIRLQHERRAILLSVLLDRLIVEGIQSGQNEAVWIALDLIAQPRGAGYGPNENEQRGRRGGVSTK